MNGWPDSENNRLTPNDYRELNADLQDVDTSPFPNAASRAVDTLMQAKTENANALLRKWLDLWTRDVRMFEDTLSNGFHPAWYEAAIRTRIGRRLGLMYPIMKKFELL
jgi:hypothetical protein